MAESDQKLLRLNQWQTVFVILGVVFSIAAACGTYLILPFRMTEIEKNHIALELRVKALEDGRQKERELMIRIDERTKSIQDKLKIPHNENE